MNIEQSIQPVSRAFHRSSSRPPKIELIGILIPLDKAASKVFCNFKLETAQNEYVLRMSDAISMLANKLEWEEVTVKGYLEPTESLIDVEKISLTKRSDPFRSFLSPTDVYFELDQYKKSIARKGMLDVATDDLAS